MNIYLVVEIKHREFLSRLLIGATSAINGNDVLIGDDEIIKLIVNKTMFRFRYRKIGFTRCLHDPLRDTIKR